MMTAAVSPKVNQYLHFKVDSKGILSMAKNKDTVCSFSKREVDIKDNGKTIKCMALGNYFIVLIS
jgi:hypothetical protein